MYQGIKVVFLLYLFISKAFSSSINPDEVLVYKTIDSVNLTLHLFNPDGHKQTDKAPVIVFFFGGGWVNGDPEHFYRQSKYLASKGMVAISVEYRTESKHGTEPRHSVEDAKSSIRWVRMNATTLGIDPNRIVAGGGSSGGHLAAATAYLKYLDNQNEDLSVSSRPNALVLFNPVFDNGPNGFRYRDVKSYWQFFSPIDNIRSTALPTVLFFGTQDQLVPLKTIYRYKRTTEKNGGRCDLFLYENQKHGFFNNTKYYIETIKETVMFLRSIGFVSKEK